MASRNDDINIPTGRSTSSRTRSKSPTYSSRSDKTSKTEKDGEGRDVPSTRNIRDLPEVDKVSEGKTGGSSSKDDAVVGAFRPLSDDAARYSHYNNRYNKGTKRKKSHVARNIVLVLLFIIIVAGVAAGYTGYTLYNSAKVVKGDASAIMADLSDLKDPILAEDSEKANALASDIAEHAANMKEETSGWAWDVACYIPVYGSDIQKVKELAVIMDDLSQEAIVPLVGEVSQISIKNLLHDGAVDVELAQRLVNAVNDAAPVINEAYEKLEAMGDANLEQINEPLKKAREKLGSLNTATQFVAKIAPTFTDMLGANGEARTYLIVAQNNSEIRSTGGFLGSIGPLYVENGAIELGDFRTIYDIYPAVLDGVYAPITDEEASIFGTHVSYQMADSNFIPDFKRVGEIVKYAWEEKGYGNVDGVIGVDPVFLQHMLAIAGGIETSDGTVVDGSNAARLLLHEAYYMDPDYQDPFFEEVAARAFKQLMTHLGDVPLMDFVKTVKSDIDARRVQVYMVRDNEEAAIEAIGADGRLPHDATKPTLGVYFTDESYSKLFWYQKADIQVGDAVQNEDGSKTYPVTVTYWNMVDPDYLEEVSDYMRAHSSIRRTDEEMICWIFLSAPEGGYISDFDYEGEFMPKDTTWRTNGAYVSGEMSHATLQGLDFWYGLTRTLPGESFTLYFNVTTSPDAVEDLKVIRTPNAQEVAGW